MENTFCKVEDSNKNQFILTDKFKQPLQCNNKQNTCTIKNYKKLIDNPSLAKQYKTGDEFVEDTKIPCVQNKNGFTELIDK